MDLAELGIIYVSEGADAAIAKMEEFRDAAAEVVQTDEERVKAAGKVASATEALSAQITRSIISYQGAKSAQYEYSAIAMGANEQILYQIQLLKELEEMDRLATSSAKELSQEHRNEQGYLQDLAKDIQNLNRVRAKEASDAEAARQTELDSRQKYYDNIVAKAKASEQAIADARHKSILDAQDATARAAAMYIKEENDKVKEANKTAQQIAAANKRTADDAATAAERQAMSEIAWALKSRDEQIRIKAEIATYKAAGVSDSTIANKFGSASLTGAIKETETLAEKFENIRLNTSRVRTEAVVLAHEMVQGRFSRIPATMMVFAEYSDLSALAMSGLGLAIMGTVAVGVALSYFMVKGILEQKAMADALIMTGNYAGTTASGLNDMAHAAAGAHGSIAVAKDIMTQLASSGKMTRDEIAMVGTAIVGIEHATGMGEKGVGKLVSQFESLQVQATAHSRYSDEISRATVKLDGEYHFLSTAVLANIQALESEGRQKEASTLATQAFANALKGRTAEMEANLGNIESAWNRIKHAIGGAKDAVMGWGKDASPTDLLKTEQTKLDSYHNKDYQRNFQITPEQISAQEEKVTELKRQAIIIGNAAYEQGERSRKQTEANLALEKNHAEAIKVKADKIGIYETKKAAAEENLAKILASPTTTPEVAEKAKKEVDDLIAAYDKLEISKKPKEHLDTYEKLVNDILKFSNATDDMTESGKKQTAAERFQSEELVKLDAALKTHNITVEEYNKLTANVGAEKERRDLAQNQVEINKAAAAAKERSNKESEREGERIAKNNELLKAANVAAKDHIATVEHLAASKIAGVGIGSAGRSDMAVLDGIETRRQKEKDTIEREGVIRGKQWANERLAIATKSFDDEVASYKRTREILARINKDWNNGAKESYKNYLDGINNVAKDTEKMFDKAFQGMEDIMVNFVKTGKLDFKSLADSIISDLIRIEVRQSMMKGMSSAMMGGGSWLASLFNANGNAFTSSGVQGFADGGAFHNSVLTRTTPFMFASGGGFSQAIAGEAGPEAVMPLTRGANGKLGVQSSGGGGNTVTVNIIESPGNGGTQNRRTENGTDVLDVFVEKVKNSIAGDISKGSGSVPSAMSQTYGLNRVAGAY
jgi:lambda family phage tail tape measure protein